MLSVMPPDTSWQFVDWANPVNWRHPLNKGLMAWYLSVPHQQGNTTWRDLAKRNPGTLTNMAQPPTSTSGPGRTTRRGSWGQMNFDGTNDYVALPAGVIMQNNAPFSFSLWYELTATGDYQLYSEGNSSNNNSSCVLEISVGIVDFYLRNDAGTASSNPVDTGATNDGLWHHVAAVNEGNGATCRLFRDGVQRASAANNVGTTISLNTGSIGVLSRLSGLLQFFPGSIDDVRIYTRALSANAIFQLYQSSQRGSPGLLRRPGLRVGQGGTASDPFPAWAPVARMRYAPLLAQ